MQTQTSANVYGAIGVQIRLPLSGSSLIYGNQYCVHTQYGWPVANLMIASSA